MDGQQTLHETEPEMYRILRIPTFSSVVLGDTERIVGFCVNSPGAVGYCDPGMIWIADQLTDPQRVVEVAVHECLHAIFPALSEADVDQAGKQIAAFIAGVFQAKGSPLPRVRPILNQKIAEGLFPDGEYFQEVSEPGACGWAGSALSL